MTSPTRGVVTIYRFLKPNDNGGFRHFYQEGLSQPVVVRIESCNDAEKVEFGNDLKRWKVTCSLPIKLGACEGVGFSAVAPKRSIVKTSRDRLRIWV